MAEHGGGWGHTEGPSGAGHSAEAWMAKGAATSNVVLQAEDMVCKDPGAGIKSRSDVGVSL